jgi:AP-2 complex subunit mu-1
MGTLNSCGEWSIRLLQRKETHVVIQNRYRSTSNVKLPLRVVPTVNEIGTSQVQYTIVVRTNFDSKLSATSVVLRIPTPLNTTTVDCKVANGKAKYAPAENVVVWK